MPVLWLPEPAAGTSVCLAFDGSETSDWTVIKGETREGLIFTPRFGAGSTIWDPALHEGRIPKAQVSEAVAHLFSRFAVERMYCDPPYFKTEIGEWALEHGEEKVVEWATYRAVPMHAEIERFHADLASGRVSHDGCPVTALHMANARMMPRRDGRYILAKPDAGRKIDAAVASVLVHAAASDARAAGWSDVAKPSIFFLP